MGQTILCPYCLSKVDLGRPDCPFCGKELNNISVIIPCLIINHITNRLLEMLKLK